MTTPILSFSFYFYPKTVKVLLHLLELTSILHSLSVVNFSLEKRKERFLFICKGKITDY